MIAWCRKNWQFITALAVVAGWSVTQYSNHRVMSATTKIELVDAKEHRERLGHEITATTKRVNKMAKDVRKTREKMLEIDVRQQEQTKTLQKIDRSVDRLLERSVQR